MDSANVSGQATQPGAPIADRVAELLRAQGTRIRALRQAQGMTIEGLAEKAQLHFNTVGRIERGTSEASLEQQLALADALGVPLSQLSVAPASSSDERTLSAELDGEDYALIEMLDVRVSGGSGAINGGAETVGRFAFAKSWLNQKGIRPTDARIVRVRGRSMSDRINDGDILLVDVSCNQLTREGVYVIELNGEDYVKILQRDFVTGGVRIVSYNPEFPPQVLSPQQANELRITGRVVWHAGEL
ncbi:XRE family transcriptional regulator [Pseudacidovorax intermedius]|uniref:XRE family transcriptional regulator n=1 Tax=Pseudacidovorax intermedius TaxID=433924 RepID=UPI00187C4814|nr:LexA family transcriptional regulator [Pseudacidovorax intermedius]